MSKDTTDVSQILLGAHKVKDLFDGVLFSCAIQDSGEARVSASLYLTIAEQFAGALCLIEGHSSAHTAILVRSMLEALANLLNVVKDTAYLDQMRFDETRHLSNLYNSCVNDLDLQEDKKAIAYLNEQQQLASPVLQDLKAHGLKPQTIEQKFRMAGILELYAATYRILSISAHNQLSVLKQRHAGRGELRYHDDLPADSIRNLISIGIRILSIALNTLPHFTNIATPDINTALTRAAAGVCQQRCRME